MKSFFGLLLIAPSLVFFAACDDLYKSDQCKQAQEQLLPRLQNSSADQQLQMEKKIDAICHRK